MDMTMVWGRFNDYFRPRRIRRLREALPQIDEPSTRVLDVGGRAEWWAHVKPATTHITVLNIDESLRRSVESAGYVFVSGDARNLPFGDAEFDLLVSNSTVEHVGALDDQKAFADEVRRVSRAYYVQTPNPRFFIEPHFVMPFVHWLPLKVKRRLLRWTSVFGWVQKPTQAQVDTRLAGIRLIRRSEMNELFPDAVHADECLLGMTKSFVMIRHAAS
jgi:ubiquinone/menaquinone biosynthesis C-methylase UbiE